MLGGGDCGVGGGTRGQQCGHEGVLDSETVMDGWAMDGWAMNGWAMDGWNGRRTGRTEKKRLTRGGAYRTWTGTWTWAGTWTGTGTKG